LLGDAVTSRMITFFICVQFVDLASFKVKIKKLMKLLKSVLIDLIDSLHDS